MKKLIFAAILFVSITAVSKAQDKGGREEVESMRAAYLTRQLALTEDEAQKFWPVYNSYRTELNSARKERKSPKEISQLSEKDAEAVVDNIMMMRQRELDIQKKYHQKFKQVLPVKKVAMLYNAEQGFKRELVKKIQDAPRPMNAPRR